MLKQLEQYFEVDIKKLSYLSGLLIGVAIIVTLAYWVIFGFDRWTGEMQRASDLMTTAIAAPPAQANTVSPGAGQYFCPRYGAVGLPSFNRAGVPHCPGCGQVMGFHRFPFRNQTLAAAGVPRTLANTLPPGAGHYVCPRNCAVGLPSFNRAGVPHCPGCGQVMGFHRFPFRNQTVIPGAGWGTQNNNLR